MKFKSIDINCDLGEIDSVADCEQDRQLMPFISSCNIACGGHAGTEDIILKTIQNALQFKLKIGAHPGYEDPENFGRVTLEISTEQLIESLYDQINLMQDLVASQDATMNHIKLHGALYNEAENNTELANHVADFYSSEFPKQTFLCLLGGELFKACKQRNLSVVAEGFMDRAYLPNGKLKPRSQNDAVFTSPKQCAEQAIKLLNQGDIQTLCLHGDNINSIQIAKYVYSALQTSSIQIQ